MPLLFSVEPNDMDPFVEEPIYATTIWTAWSGVEQRRALRALANLRYTFSVLTESARQSGLLNSLIWGGQAQQWFVPYWPGARKLTAPVVGGATVIPVTATASAEFLAQRAAMIWRDPFLAQARIVQSVGASSVTLVTGVTGNWAQADTVLVPLFLGLLAPSVDLKMETFAHYSAQVVFDIQVAAPLPYVL